MHGSVSNVFLICIFERDGFFICTLKCWYFLGFLLIVLSYVCAIVSGSRLEYIKSWDWKCHDATFGESVDKKSGECT